MRNKDFDIWMIRMKGDRKSELYANYCAKSWTDAGFHVNFFDAITPKDLHNYKHIKFEKQINEPEKGCFLSQWLLWEKCWKEDRPILVLEHDAYLENPEVISYNPHVDITYFGQHCMEACLYRPSFAKFIWKVVTEDTNKGPFSMVEHFLGQGSRYALLSKHGRPQLRYLGPEAPVKHLVIEELGSSIVHNSGKQTSDRIKTDQADLFKVVKLAEVNV